MIQIAIVSGKGGTGKTTLSGSLISLFENRVAADCDVDAANLNLILNPQIKEKHDYYGGKKALIEQSKCTKCGLCKEVCRFEAINVINGDYIIDEYACEGCNACVVECPENAIKLIENKSGEYYYAEAAMKLPTVSAELNPGEETSGGLVAEVRKKSIEVAKEKNKEYIIIDGAPGIGCPATSSITAVDYVIIVTEPTQSGMHDLKRIVDTVKQFRRKFGVVINKYDINEDKSKEIEDYCEKENIKIIEKIPFDEIVATANVQGRTVVEYSDSKAAKSIFKIYSYLKEEVR
jgi:MinD superfamily P-loop ATPase